MNLRNGQITVGEVLQNPQARAVLQREVPQFAGMLNSPLARRYWSMPLNAAAAQAGRFLPQERIQTLLSCLERV